MLTLRTMVNTAFGAFGFRGTGPPELVLQLIVPAAPTAGIVQVQPGTLLIETNVVFAGVVTINVLSRVIFGHGSATSRS